MFYRLFCTISNPKAQFWPILRRILKRNMKNSLFLLLILKVCEETLQYCFDLFARIYHQTKQLCLLLYCELHAILKKKTANNRYNYFSLS